MSASAKKKQNKNQMMEEEYAEAQHNSYGNDEDEDAEGFDEEDEQQDGDAEVVDADGDNGQEIDPAEIEEAVATSAAELAAASSSSSSSSVGSTIPSFPALAPSAGTGPDGISYVRVPVPPHRYTPLKQQWMQIYQPIVEHMKLQIRFNPKRRAVELRTAATTEQQHALTKSADFVRAFMLGFEIRDAIALLRLEDLYIDSFEIKDVKILNGDHLSRAIGRIAGVGGKTKFTIENATKTRVVLADTHIHILGTYANLQIAKSAIVRLIMGSPPGKVYTQMRAVANRAKERF